MSSPWGKIAAPVETMRFADIMSEEYAHRLQNEELKKYDQLRSAADAKVPVIATEAAVSGLSLVGSDDADWEDCSELLAATKEAMPAVSNYVDSIHATTNNNNKNIVCDSDEVIAMMLQSQYDHEYNEELRRIEKQHNKQAKVSISLEKYRRNSAIQYLYESDDDDDGEEGDGEAVCQKRDWDHFESNAKILNTIPKCGFKVVDKEKGAMITKHDEDLCGVRNACRVMSFPLQFPTGDGAGFDMKLSNQVYNQLKSYSMSKMKKPKLNDRRENVATAEMGVDARTRLLLYKLINNRILEQINGIISTGKEAVILHANSDPSYGDVVGVAGGEACGQREGTQALLPPEKMPKECAIKIFKCTLNEFKQRDRYIKDDYRFKERFSKQNTRVIIKMWAEKEMLNIKRMKAVGINCPDVVILKQHVLVMSFIGANHIAAPKLKDAILNDTELRRAYTEIVETMHTLYNVANLIHADLSEYNILWHNDKCWFIDVAQAIEPNHPSALEFLMRDCQNICSFFMKRGLPNIFTKQQLFEHITGFDSESHNVAMLERIHTRGASLFESTAPNRDDCPDELKSLSYPFDIAWEKSQADRQKSRIIDDAANALEVLSVKCDGIEIKRETENQEEDAGH